MGDHLKALRTSGSPTGSAGSNSSSVSVASDKSITPEQVQKLVRKLGMKYTIYKPEMVQIINLRPTDLNVLSSIIEDIDHRMMDVSQQDVLDIIRECLELGPKEESEDKETEEEQEEEEDVEEA